MRSFISKPGLIIAEHVYRLNAKNAKTGETPQLVDFFIVMCPFSFIEKSDLLIMQLLIKIVVLRNS